MKSNSIHTIDISLFFSFSNICTKVNDGCQRISRSSVVCEDSIADRYKYMNEHIWHCIHCVAGFKPTATEQCTTQPDTNEA